MIQVLTSFASTKTSIKDQILKKIVYLLTCGVFSGDPCWAESYDMCATVKDFVERHSADEIHALNGILSYMRCEINSAKHLNKCSRGLYRDMMSIPATLRDNSEYTDLIAYSSTISLSDSGGFCSICKEVLRRIITDFKDSFSSELVHIVTVYMTTYSHNKDGLLALKEDAIQPIIY